MQQNDRIPQYQPKKKSLVHATYYAVCGLRTLLQEDKVFRQEIFLTVIIIPLAMVSGATAVEKVLLIGSWLLVLTVEAINSSIEGTVNRISIEIHPLSKKIKDISAAAVLLSIVNAVVIWVVILL